MPVGVDGRSIDPHDAAQWMDADTAYSMATATGYGVGFVFTDADPFWFLDVDQCLNDHGTWDQTATTALQWFPGAAVEISQSGKGLHVFGVGSIPPGYKTRNQRLGVELYGSKRFVALGSNATGNAWTDHTAALNKFVPQWFEAGVQNLPVDWTDKPCPEYTGPQDDELLIQNMLASGGAAKVFGGKATINQLWENDIEALSDHFPDPEQGRPYDSSAADGSLATHLAFWTGKDCARIERLMRRSALVRDKWDQHGSYLYRTITGAVAKCGTVYDKPTIQQGYTLDVGSDLEMAQIALEALRDEHGEIVHCDGYFWRFGRTRWVRFEHNQLRRMIHEFDRSKTNQGGTVKLGKSKIDSIIHEMSTIVEDWNFFSGSPRGISCESGFIRFDQYGNPSEEPHASEHRNRHVVAGKWRSQNPVTLPKDSLLYRLLHGSFLGDADFIEKVALIQEISGVVALGIGTRIKKPKAMIFYGASAENGKSQFLELFRSLVPPDSTSSISPSKFQDDKHVIKLAGKVINCSDELSNADAISSDRFKAIITGEPVSARDVYKSAVDFLPTAQHVYATNELPYFKGGLDRGVLRRLAVIGFNRTIPPDERVPGIGRRIASEEADLLIAFAVEGASRIIRNGTFTEPESSQQELREWILGADPVAAWIEFACVVDRNPNSAPPIRTAHAHNMFLAWAGIQGFEKTTPSENHIFHQTRHGDLRPRC